MLSTIFFVGRVSQSYLNKLGKNITHVGDIPPLLHGLFVLYKINIAIATTNKGVKWSAFVKTTANMESWRHFLFTQKNIVVLMTQGLASHCNAKTTFTFHFSIINA